MKLTPWYPGTVKPVRDGVYQRKYGAEALYCKYERGRWFAWAGTPEVAFQVRVYSHSNKLPWRGVAK